MKTPDFMGLNSFVWWFGVVENRTDPLNMGRCQVRCFGWHSDNVNEIQLEDLPWAHPVVPFGVSNIHPPKEGTMVFGFFADGKEARFPILLGTVPGVPNEVREPQQGFSDPLTDAQRAGTYTPRKVKSSTITKNGAGPIVENDTAKRYPVNVDEPTVSRLARPVRVEAGAERPIARSDSFENTTIAIQKRNVVANVKSARGVSWNEPEPAYNAEYPFNNVIESESGHAFEIDDTVGFERVQLSHRVGSTLEFMESGAIKMKAFEDKYDITMRNQFSYVNGIRDETCQSDMYLKVAGKLTIHCDQIEFVSSGDMTLKGQNVNISATDDINIAAQKKTSLKSGGIMSLVGATALSAFGGIGGARLSSSGVVMMDGAVATKVSGPDFVINSFICSIDSAVTNILPPAVPSLTRPPAPSMAAYKKVKSKPIEKVTPAIRRQKMSVIKDFKRSNTSNTSANTG